MKVLYYFYANSLHATLPFSPLWFSPFIITLLSHFRLNLTNSFGWMAPIYKDISSLLYFFFDEQPLKTKKGLFGRILEAHSKGLFRVKVTEKKKKRKKKEKSSFLLDGILFMVSTRCKLRTSFLLQYNYSQFSNFFWTGVFLPAYLPDFILSTKFFLFVQLYCKKRKAEDLLCKYNYTFKNISYILSFKYHYFSVNWLWWSIDKVHFSTWINLLYPTSKLVFS